VRLLEGPAEGAIAVTVTSLEMTSADRLIPAAAPDGATWHRVQSDKHSTSRAFYRDVGGPWFWVDRLTWTDAQWQEWTDRDVHHLIVCQRDGRDAGYAELEQQSDGNVEIAYFGLLPEMIGKGLGRWWLSEVIAEAWRLPGTRRVWVHTCTLDGPAALATYTGRGLQPYAREVEWRLPAPTDAPRLAP
jgi:GNAT superfamily N-acetyltransferase